MFIGHLPASYLWTRFLINHWKQVLNHMSAKKVIVFGMIASLLPDLDIIYFYFVDHRKHLHHGYWTHIPFFWLAIFGIWLLIGLAFKRSKIFGLGIIMGSNILLHMVLDTIVGKVRWLYPLSRHDFFLTDVPAIHGWWVWNFVLHWTFVLELAIVISAIYVWGSNYKMRPNILLQGIAQKPRNP
jgi:inner membrane protein